jgi:hypothetical protein
MMTPLEYLMDGMFECGSEDASMVAFAKATSIIGGDTVEEFLACGTWLLSEGCEFEVE